MIDADYLQELVWTCNLAWYLFCWRMKWITVQQMYQHPTDGKIGLSVYAWANIAG